jgi:hypothetical protein
MGHAEDARHWRDVAEEVVIQFIFEERRVDRARSSDQEKRIAIGGRPYDRLGPDRCDAPGPSAAG